VKLRQPVRQFTLDRHHSISKELVEVREQLRTAQEKYNEFTGKLKSVDSETKALREQTQQEAIALKQRIQTEARHMSTVLVADAKSSSQNLFVELKEQLYHELMGRVIERTEKVVRDRITGADKDRISREFSLQLEKLS
jgi:F0F1-type ATP synthase membrane subunit b/b'